MWATVVHRVVVVAAAPRSWSWWASSIVVLVVLVLVEVDVVLAATGRVVVAAERGVVVIGTRAGVPVAIDDDEVTADSTSLCAESSALIPAAGDHGDGRRRRTRAKRRGGDGPPPECDTHAAAARLDRRWAAPHGPGDAMLERMSPGARTETADQMAHEARSWLSSLDDVEWALAQRAFPSDDDRRRWFYTPTDHGGLALGEMRPSRQRGALRLLVTGLSEAGYNTVATIIGLENILDASEGWRHGFGRERGRDPGLYHVRVFGEPRPGATWAWRFGGHHVSINHLIVDGDAVATTPCFMGADPASSPLLGPHLLRPLAGSRISAVSSSARWRPRRRDGRSCRRCRPSTSSASNRSRLVGRRWRRSHCRSCSARRSTTRRVTATRRVAAANGGCARSATRAHRCGAIQHRAEGCAGVRLHRRAT